MIFYRTLCKIQRLLVSGAMLGLLCMAGVSVANIEEHQFDNPADEALYASLIKELRCLVCQNQNLADSNADLAKDLRQKTYEMINEGKTREQISEYMVARYGDFVLYRPPVQKKTYLLWVGPFVFLLIALIAVFVILRRKSTSTAPKSAPLSDAALDTAKQHLNKH